MIYIIQCGCDPNEESPKHLNVVNGETIVARTLRLLRECGISNDDIGISSCHRAFEKFGVTVYKHDNRYYGTDGSWVDGFFPFNEPVCYIFGDVVFSPEAIRKIISTDTDDVEFFASAPPFAENYIKKWAEPFAFKVVNTSHFRSSIEKVKAIKHQFKREPISWELWQVIKDTPINKVDYTNYTVINDYTCDVDHRRDVNTFNQKVFNLI